MTSNSLQEVSTWVVDFAFEPLTVSLLSCSGAFFEISRWVEGRFRHSKRSKYVLLGILVQTLFADTLNKLAQNNESDIGVGKLFTSLCNGFQVADFVP